MHLTLTLLGPARLMGARTAVSLEIGSLTIGRSPAADWVIPDPDRVLSKQHCRIDADSTRFVLTDTSTNGVYVNDEPDPLGYGLSRALRDGDRLRLGDAQVQVVIAQAGRTAQPPHEIAPLAAAPPEAIILRPRVVRPGPFGPAPRPSSGAPAAASPPPPPTAPVKDDWWDPALTDPSGSVPPSPAEPPVSARGLGLLPESDTDSGPSVVGVVESIPNLPSRTLAQAVDAAGRELGDNEWRTFCNKLRAILEREHSQAAKG